MAPVLYHWLNATSFSLHLLVLNGLVQQKTVGHLHTPADDKRGLSYLCQIIGLVKKLISTYIPRSHAKTFDELREAKFAKACASV